MADPFFGVLLNGRYYKFDADSYSISTPLRNTSTETHRGRNLSVGGKGFDTHSITLVLENTYEVVGATTNDIIGTTTWQGTSRLYQLKQDLGAKGVSMPIAFYTPFGVTHSVIPTGSIDANRFLNQVQDTGYEWRVNLTLEDTTDV